MQFLYNNLGTTCHLTSLTFSETIYISEAQNYAKSVNQALGPQWKVTYDWTCHILLYCLSWIEGLNYCFDLLVKFSIFSMATIHAIILTTFSRDSRLEELIIVILLILYSLHCWFHWSYISLFTIVISVIGIKQKIRIINVEQGYH